MEQPSEKITRHYRAEYFTDYQREYGEFGGRANRFMFEEHINRMDTVLDFGCGGGFLLNNLACEEKIGVEINATARSFCNEILGIKCYESLEWIDDESVDVVISSHCLEHTINPFQLVAKMYDKLKDGGRIIIVVPLENDSYRWVPHDVNNHLYSFSPMNLGNILQGVGFKKIRTEVIHHKWVPHYRKVTELFGLNTFHHLSRFYGRFVNKRCVQVKGVGIKSIPDQRELSPMSGL